MTMIPAAVRAANAMSEAELQASVRTMCDDLGLAVEHVTNSLQGRTWLPGMPDLIIFGTKVLWRELKDERNICSGSQRKVRGVITRAGGDWALWRPSDLLDGTIARELSAIRV